MKKIVMYVKEWFGKLLGCKCECEGSTADAEGTVAGETSGKAEGTVVDATEWVKNDTDEDIEKVILTEREFWVVIAQSKYYDEKIGMETYLAGYLFETEEDANRHADDVKMNSETFLPVGVLKVKTDVPGLSVAKVDYTRNNEHPTPTVKFVAVDDYYEKMKEETSANTDGTVAEEEDKAA